MTKARAKERGYYPIGPGGPCDIVEFGQVFDLVDGQTKGKWFEVLVEDPVQKPEVVAQKSKAVAKAHKPGDDGALT